MTWFGWVAASEGVDKEVLGKLGSGNEAGSAGRVAVEVLGSPPPSVIEGDNEGDPLVRCSDSGKGCNWVGTLTDDVGSAGTLSSIAIEDEELKESEMEAVRFELISGF